MARDFKILPTVNGSPVIAESKVDAKGDLLVGSAADTVIRVAVGANGKVLKANSAASGGVAWEDESGGGGGSTSFTSIMKWGVD